MDDAILPKIIRYLGEASFRIGKLFYSYPYLSNIYSQIEDLIFLKLMYNRQDEVRNITGPRKPQTRERHELIES